jgi:RNA recognition motif-containing protein
MESSEAVGQSTFLVIDNLPRSLSGAELGDLCRPFGTVLFSKVVRDNLTRSLGFGYVQMASADTAQKAQQALDYSTLRGNIIRVSSLRQLPPGYDNAGALSPLLQR